jgi:hypothetical protein
LQPKSHHGAKARQQLNKSFICARSLSESVLPDPAAVDTDGSKRCALSGAGEKYRLSGEKLNDFVDNDTLGSSEAAKV